MHRLDIHYTVERTNFYPFFYTHSVKTKELCFLKIVRASHKYLFKSTCYNILTLVCGVLPNCVTNAIYKAYMTLR